MDMGILSQTNITLCEINLTEDQSGDKIKGK